MSRRCQRSIQFFPATSNFRPSRTKAKHINGSRLKFRLSFSTAPFISLTLKSGLYVFVPILLLVLWFAVTSFGTVPAVLLPAPVDVLEAFVHLTFSGELFGHVLASAARSLTGFCLASLTGIGLGLLFSRTPRAEQGLHLILEALRVTPPLAMVPLLILWLGINEAPKIAIVFLSGFFPIYLNTMTAFSEVDRKLLEVGASLDFTASETFRLIVLPSAMPGILTGLRLGFGYSWRALVGAELFAASSGLGYLINESGEYLKTDCVFVGIITIAVLGIAADRLLTLVFGHFVPQIKMNSSSTRKAP